MGKKMVKWVAKLSALAGGPGFRFQHPHSNSQLSVTRGLSTLLWPLWAPPIYTVHPHMCRQTLTHTQNKNKQIYIKIERNMVKVV